VELKQIKHNISGDGTLAQNCLEVSFDDFRTLFLDNAINNFETKLIESIYKFNKSNYKYPNITFMTSKQFNVISKIINRTH
jgi:hypothetical protein